MGPGGAEGPVEGPGAADGVGEGDGGGQMMGIGMMQPACAAGRIEAADRIGPLM
jgi:hypothetical protein